MSAEDTPEIYSLPLFPLHFVLFPHFPLQLHVFEARYRAMIAACIARNEPFGVVLIQEGEEVGAPAVPHEIGCTARILAIKQLENGRMNLLAAGETRFRLLDYMVTDLPDYLADLGMTDEVLTESRDQKLLIGRVETVNDVPVSTEEQKPLARELQTLFLRYLNLLAERLGERIPQVELMDDPTLLAFYIASISTLTPTDKQRLLTMTDPCLRIEKEIRWLHAELEELEAGRVRQKQLDTPEEEVAVRLVARPLDRTSERWQRYRDSGRN
jgi:Lon protease-like protein